MTTYPQFPADGTLFNVASGVPVYVMILGQACWIPSPTAAGYLYGTNWGPPRLTTITSTQFATVPLGPSLANGATITPTETNPVPVPPVLVSTTGGTTTNTYLLVWNQALLVTTAGQAVYGFITPTLTVDQSVIDAMIQGPYLTQ